MCPTPSSSDLNKAVLTGETVGEIEAENDVAIAQVGLKNAGWTERTGRAAEHVPGKYHSEVVTAT